VLALLSEFWSDYAMKMTTIAFTEAKAHLSEYGRRAETGEVTLVLKHRHPSFVIGPAPQTAQTRAKFPGLARGRIHMAPDFDVTPEDVINAFEGSL
jgi:antitoxin (DNA-binding transcriptional repressor) of toxin-antitoxin stability system